MNQEVYKFIDQADDFLKDAEYLMTGDRYKGVVNRSYYAIFAAVQALLFAKDEFSKTHTGVANKFYSLYIKTNIFSTDFGKVLNRAYQKRQTGDYDAGAHITFEEAAQVLEDARWFLNETRIYIDKNR
ncbi:HEPN domain-containing protein [Runella salmonicolor]|uniref:HEPN domain-containing protein n=1 Tax=Runella salmonicolor TaxID=2950278 RepID=A0ABT1FLH5_9BACT|nr:HEPN domain-containing protein [Runella salmonicolor]MCP1382586.1 HEPN domain-containing protein [Runella salmonicolor]